jgi:hypothetical protein
VSLQVSLSVIISFVVCGGRYLSLYSYLSHLLEHFDIYFVQFYTLFRTVLEFWICSVKSYSKCLHPVETKFLLISLVLFQFYA